MVLQLQLEPMVIDRDLVADVREADADLVFGASMVLPAIDRDRKQNCQHDRDHLGHSATQNAIWARIEASSAPVMRDRVAVRRACGTHWTFHANA